MCTQGPEASEHLTECSLANLTSAHPLGHLDISVAVQRMLRRDQPAGCKVCPVSQAMP